MYLSKLLLDPASRQVQSELSNRYELHRTLTAQFPSEKRSDINLLYRLEIPDQQIYQPITLLVQTSSEPDWSELARLGLLIDSPQVKNFDPDLPTGATYFFRLLANPTMRKKQADGNSKRIGLYSTEAQHDWLQRKAQQGGFRVESFNLLDMGMLESIKRKNDHIHKIKQLAVQFDGILNVIDPDLIKHALVHGVGSAKSFGFGLLSLAKR